MGCHSNNNNNNIIIIILITKQNFKNKNNNENENCETLFYWLLPPSSSASNSLSNSTPLISFLTNSLNRDQLSEGTTQQNPLQLPPSTPLLLGKFYFGFGSFPARIRYLISEF